MTMKATIYHNPRCGTSRNTLAILRHAGIEPTIIEYLKTPPDRATLLRLLVDAGRMPREGARQKEKLFEELVGSGESVQPSAIPRVLEVRSGLALARAKRGPRPRAR